MTRLRELVQPDDYQRLSQLDRHAVRFVWIDHWWDGPLAGLLVYRGAVEWFEAARDYIAEHSDDAIRHYLVVALTEAQRQELLRRKDLFERYVGTHWTYDEAEQRPRDHPVKPQELWDTFYGDTANQAEMDLSANEAVGWFAD